ncbi:unnamed protein product, partial [Meganyctiphanes norvegica]
MRALGLIIGLLVIGCNGDKRPQNRHRSSVNRKTSSEEQTDAGYVFHEPSGPKFNFEDDIDVSVESHGKRKHDYQAPSQTYGRPTKTNSPVDTYAAPKSTYGPPVDSYKVPVATKYIPPAPKNLYGTPN